LNISNTQKQEKMETRTKNTEYAKITWTEKKATNSALNKGWLVIIEKVHTSKINGAITIEKFYSMGMNDFFNGGITHKFYTKFK
jgi:hypothetical protein